ncbi:DUF86 domain-containing protein [Candidatus Saganbacteria bacterium]|nr:DUF86 domain-containing protein [Candidatus Saganbacteria bacterium]
MGNNQVYLSHIFEAIEKIEQYLSGKSQEILFQDDMRLDAVVRELEIIGEAAKNISADFCKKNPSIPWQDMVGMRNRLIHEYFGVDRKVVWDTCKTDLPILKKLLSPII